MGEAAGGGAIHASDSAASRSKAPPSPLVSKMSRRPAPQSQHRQAPPLSSQLGTYETVRNIFWSWLSVAGGGKGEGDSRVGLGRLSLQRIPPVLRLQDVQAQLCDLWGLFVPESYQFMYLHT